ncbi:MAG: family 16 glycoside hydrolase [Candidatus Sumerlaeia bacterium]
MRASCLSQIKPFVFAWALVLVCAFSAAEDNDEKDWISLFDGKRLKGWKANESAETWSVEEGVIVAKGPVSHLYYVGDDEKKPRTFSDFELKLEARTVTVHAMCP